MPGSEMDALPMENSHHPAVSLIQTGGQERHCTNTTVIADDCDIKPAKPRQSSRKNLITLLAVFVVSLLFMTILFSNFPELDDEDVSSLCLPRTIDDAKDLGRLLSKYKDTHYFTVLGTMFATYILYPFHWVVWELIEYATGALFCYFLSSMVGHGLVNKYFPDRLKSWRTQAAHHHDDMLWYIIFLRITPFLPNWFINLASPIIGVRVAPFYWGTFLGVAPPSFFFIRAGTTLYQLTTATGHVSMQSVAVLAGLAILSLLPVLFKRTLRKKLE